MYLVLAEINWISRWIAHTLTTHSQLRWFSSCQNFFFWESVDVGSTVSTLDINQDHCVPLKGYINYVIWCHCGCCSQYMNAVDGIFCEVIFSSFLSNLSTSFEEEQFDYFTLLAVFIMLLLRHAKECCCVHVHWKLHEWLNKIRSFWTLGKNSINISLSCRMLTV